MRSTHAEQFMRLLVCCWILVAERDAHKIYATVTIYYKKRGACDFFLVLHIDALNLKSITATDRHPKFMSLITSLKVGAKISNFLIPSKSVEMILYTYKTIELWYEVQTWDK